VAEGRRGSGEVAGGGGEATAGDCGDPAEGEAAADYRRSRRSWGRRQMWSRVDRESETKDIQLRGG
jgi:hypothetical protein